MNGEFFIDGKKYISASRASKLTGYAMDYIGQLSRSGKLDSRMIGRSWFVSEDSLLGYKRTAVDIHFEGKSQRKTRRKNRRSKAAPLASETGSPSASADTTPAADAGAFPILLAAPQPEGASAASSEEEITLSAHPLSEIEAAAEVALPPREDHAPAFRSSVRIVSLDELAALSQGKRSLESLNDLRRASRLQRKAASAASIEALSKIAPAALPSPYIGEMPGFASAAASKTDVSAGALHASLAASSKKFSTASLLLDAPKVPGALPSPYMDPRGASLLMGAGNFLIGTAIAFALFVVAAGSSSLYISTQAGALALGAGARGAADSGARTIARTPVYYRAGVAVVERSLGATHAGTGFDGSVAAAASSDASVSDATASLLTALERAWSYRVDAIALGIFNRTNSFVALLVPHADITATKLATDASAGGNAPSAPAGSISAGPKRQGMAIVPSTGNAAEDKKVSDYIKSTFSDDVKVVKENADGTGVIKPVFKSGTGENYLYVLVPLPADAPPASTPISQAGPPNGSPPNGASE